MNGNELTVRVNVPSNSAKNSLKLSFVILLIFIWFEITLEQLGKQIVIVSSLIKFYTISIKWLSIATAHFILLIVFIVF